MREETVPSGIPTGQNNAGTNFHWSCERSMRTIHFYTKASDLMTANILLKNIDK